MATAFSYRREIDGLRALAVLPVLFFHAGFETFSGGFVGVDIFFVISGYLITSILIMEFDEGRFSLMKFYERRARRILPALCTVILVSAIAAYVIMLPEQWTEFLQSAISVIFFASNIFFWMKDDYFSQASEEKPLLHSWSLAVEEQYYILFPLILMMLWRFGRNPILCCVALLSLLSFLSAEYGSRHYSSANFYLLFGRAWEIFAGSITAFYMSRADRKIYNRPFHIFASWAGFLILCFAIFLFDTDTPFPSSYAMLPVIGTVLIIIFARSDEGIGKILAMPLLVGIGLISYSLYLWHQPVFAFARLLIFDMGLMIKMALLSLSVILAVISYYGVEKPARFKWLKLETPRVFLIKASIIPIIMAVAAASLLWFKTPPLNQAVDYAGVDKEWNYERKYAGAALGRITLYGDSHARQYAGAIEDYAALSGYDFALLAGPACISFPGLTNYYRDQIWPECMEQWQRLHEEVKSADDNGKQDLIIIAHRWGPILSDIKGNKLGQIGDADKNKSDQAAQALFQSIDIFLAQFDENQRFIFIGNVPAAAPASPQMQRGISRCQQLIGGDCPRYFARKDGELYAFNQQMRQMLSQYPNVQFIDPYDSLCDEKYCYVARGDAIYYSDDAHLTNAGALRFLTTEADTLDAVLSAP